MNNSTLNWEKPELITKDLNTTEVGTAVYFEGSHGSGTTNYTNAAS